MPDPAVVGPPKGHRRALAMVRDTLGELINVARRTLGDGVGEISDPIDDSMAVLDLEPVWHVVSIDEAEVAARFGARQSDLHSELSPRVEPVHTQRTPLEQHAHDRVGALRVGAAGAWHTRRLDEFPSVQALSFRTRGCGLQATVEWNIRWNVRWNIDRTCNHTRTSVSTKASILPGLTQCASTISPPSCSSTRTTKRSRRSSSVASTRALSYPSVTGGDVFEFATGDVMDCRASGTPKEVYRDSTLMALVEVPDTLPW